MKGYRLWICGLALLLLSGLTTFAQQAPQDMLQGDLNGLLQQLNLTVDQQSQVKEKTAAAYAPVVSWEQQHQDEITKLKTDAKSADAGVADKAKAQLKSLQEERQKLHDAQQPTLRKDIYDILTPEQRQMLLGINSYKQLNYPTMVKVLALTPEQDAKLKEAAMAYSAGLAKWQEENGGKMSQLDQQINQWNQQIKDAKAAQQTLIALKDKVDAERVDALKATITPAQQIAWKSYNLQQRENSEFNRTKLTDEQIGKIKALCDQMANDTPFPLKDKEWNTADAKLVVSIRDQVLTDDQRALYKTYKLQDDMLGQFRGVRLTTEQIDKAKELCAQTAKNIQVPPASSSDYEKRAKLQQTIREQVLTDDQRAAIK